MGKKLLSARQILYALIALAMLVSTAIRPPGTMLTLVGDTLTFTLCTGGDAAVVTVNLDEDDDRIVDIGCDPFTLQLATFPSYTAAFGAAPIQWSELERAEQFALVYAARVWRPYTSRAPPYLS